MSKYFIKGDDRFEAAKKAADLLTLEMRRRKFLKATLGAGVGLAGVATFAAQCGEGTAPTATTAPAAGTTVPSAATEVPTTIPAEGTIAPAGTSVPAGAATSGVEVILPDVPVLEVRTSYPYGGSGIADRAMNGAKAVTNKNPIGFAYASGSRPNWEPFIPEWRAYTGIDVKLIEIPIGEIYEKMMQGAVTKESSWDIFVTNPRAQGDLIGAGAITDWTDYSKKYGQIITGKPYGFIGDAPSKYQTYYNGKVYAYSADGDIFSLLYRADWYDDPAQQKGFKDKYGYDIAMDTWEHYRDVCEWFTKPDQNQYGSDNIRSRNWGFWWWEMHYASQAIPNFYYFDQDMKPLVDSPEGLAATKQYISFKPASHPDVMNWDWSQQYAAFTGGGQFSIIAWPSIDKYTLDPSTSKLKKEQIKYGLVPGTMVGGKLNRRSVYAYGNALMGWAHGQADKEAAYCFAQFMTSPEISGRSLEQLGFEDPYRWTDLNHPLVQKTYGVDFLKEFYQNFKISVPDVFLQGSGEFTQQLDGNVQEAWTGSKSPEDAMKTTAAAWTEIVDRIGKDTLKEVWKTLKSYYPTLDTSGTAGKISATLPD